MTLLTARQIGIISGHQRSGYYVDAQNMMIVFMFFFYIEKNMTTMMKIVHLATGQGKVTGIV